MYLVYFSTLSSEVVILNVFHKVAGLYVCRFPLAQCRVSSWLCRNLSFPIWLNVNHLYTRALHFTFYDGVFSKPHPRLSWCLKQSNATWWLSGNPLDSSDCVD